MSHANVDLSEHIANTFASLHKMAAMEGFGLTKPPHFRELEVSDEHVVYLLTLVADDLLAKRRRGETADYAALEMQAALNTMLVAR